jgi:hypothetical protein
MCLAAGVMWQQQQQFGDVLRCFRGSHCGPVWALVHNHRQQQQQQSKGGQGQGLLTWPLNVPPYCLEGIN